MKIFELLIVIPVTLLSPQVRFKKTPLDFGKGASKIGPFQIWKTFL